MATKKTTQKPVKNKTKPTAKKSVPKKTVVKKPAVVKSAKKKTEPHHFCFGCIMMIVGFVIFLALVVSLACFLAKTVVTSDAEKFAAEYSEVEKDNLFVYKSGEEIVELLEHGTGVIFLGFPSCPWCQAYAPMLNDVAKTVGIDAIYYHNTYDDWQNDTDVYKKITEILGSNLQFDEAGNRHLYVPNTVFVKDGVIIGNDFETSKDTADAKTPEEYWTEERVDVFKTRIASFLFRLK